MPASGEDAAVADPDNDGSPDLCLATGFSPTNAAIVIYPLGENGLGQSPLHVIVESRRFGNVRFVVCDLDRDGANEIVAWWCTDLSMGECEMIRYTLDSGGVRERVEITHGDAGDLWPRDGQFAVADTDGDGVSEVWFVATSGHLSRYESGHASPLTRVGVVKGELGPLASGRGRLPSSDCLYVGCGSRVLRIERTDLQVPSKSVASIEKE